MSATIKAAIDAAKSRIASVYSKVAERGGTIPATQNLASLPDAIESIPSGGGEVDLSWWKSASFLVNPINSSFFNPTHYGVVSAYLTKNATDKISVKRNGYVTGKVGSSWSVVCYLADYRVRDYFALTELPSTLSNTTIFRVFANRYEARFLKIENDTSGEIYWKGDLYDEDEHTFVTKDDLLSCINEEKGSNAKLYLSTDKYNEFANDQDVVLALNNHPNVTLVNI